MNIQARPRKSLLFFLGQRASQMIFWIGEAERRQRWMRCCGGGRQRRLQNRARAFCGFAAAAPEAPGGLPAGSATTMWRYNSSSNLLSSGRCISKA